MVAKIENGSSQPVGKGRPSAFEPDEYLEAVKKLKTLNDGIISKHLGVDYSTVYRFRKKKQNKEIIDKAEMIINEVASLGYSRDIEVFEVFKNLDIVKEWASAMRKRKPDIRNETVNSWIRGLWHICKYLKRHPSKLSVEECAELNLWIRDLYYSDIREEIPRGLGYQNTRETIRGFFMSIHNMSAQYLTNIGVTKENIPTFGKFSKMSVSKTVRHQFEQSLKKFIKDEHEYWDTLNFCVMGYATATRATALSEVELRNRKEFTDKLWVFEVIDKGGLHWDKIITGSLLEKLRNGISKRFRIQIDELETKLPTVTKYLFPLAYTNVNRLRELIKSSLIDAGIQYTCEKCDGKGEIIKNGEKIECYICKGSGWDFPPIHIWRHTFAQDALKASGWNYELVASIGGWKSTKILKEVYGEIGLDVKISGVRKMMGLPEEEKAFYLEW